MRLPKSCARPTGGSHRLTTEYRATLQGQKAKAASLGTLWQDHGLIFPGHAGQPMRAWSLTGGPFLRLLKRAGLPEKTRFHDLRHTCATLLLGKSVDPKIVQELLGHATISITLDTYSHVLPGYGRPGGKRDGRSSVAVRWCTRWCSKGRDDTRPSLLCLCLSCKLAF